jgi:hypothetical protein
MLKLVLKLYNSKEPKAVKKRGSVLFRLLCLQMEFLVAGHS